MMIKRDQTTLQVFEFGDTPSDTFYCLVDLRVSPEGMNPDQLRLADPRRLDMEFRQNGCLLMLTGDEVDEIVRRGDADRSNLHESIYRLAANDGII